jgi:clan AA aspartic protease (TIGR02281 family)
VATRVQCPACGAHFKTREEFAGRRFPCPNCSKVIVIPGGDDSPLGPPPGQSPDQASGGAETRQPRDATGAMGICPLCAADVPEGETVCPACHGELSLAPTRRAKVDKGRATARAMTSGSKSGSGGRKVVWIITGTGAVLAAGLALVVLSVALDTSGRSGTAGPTKAVDRSLAADGQSASPTGKRESTSAADPNAFDLGNAAGESKPKPPAQSPAEVHREVRIDTPEAKRPAQLPPTPRAKPHEGERLAQIEPIASDDERPAPRPAKATSAEPAKRSPAAAGPQDEAPAAPPPERPKGMKPEEFLKRYDLVSSDRFWLLADEKAIHQQMAAIEKLRREIVKRQPLVKSTEHDRQAADDALRKARDNYRVLDRQADAAVALRQSDVAVLTAARNHYEMAKQAGDQANRAASEARAAANSLGESLAAEVAKAREKYHSAKQHYAVLAEAPAIHQAIEDFNTEAEKTTSLGPSESFRNLARKLEGLDAAVAAISDRIPIRQRDGLWFVDVSLNDKKKLEMAIDTGASILCLPWQAAIDSGLDPRSGRPIVAEVADGRSVRALELSLTTVQIGRFTAKNVRCTVLPSDAGDVMPLLGQTFLGRYSYRIDAAERMLVISGASDATKGKPRK